MNTVLLVANCGGWADEEEFITFLHVWPSKIIFIHILQVSVNLFFFFFCCSVTGIVQASLEKQGELRGTHLIFTWQSRWIEMNEWERLRVCKCWSKRVCLCGKVRECVREGEQEKKHSRLWNWRLGLARWPSLKVSSLHVNKTALLYNTPGVRRLANGCLKNTTTAAHEITLYWLPICSWFWG